MWWETSTFRKKWDLSICSYGTPPKAIYTSKKIQLETYNELLKVNVGSQENATNIGRVAISCSLFVHQALIEKTRKHTEKPLLWRWLEGAGKSSHCSASPSRSNSSISPAAWKTSSAGGRAQNCSPLGGSPSGAGEWYLPPKLNSDPAPSHS